MFGLFKRNNKDQVTAHKNEVKQFSNTIEQTLPASQHMSRNDKTYTIEGYIKNTVVFRSIDALAKSVASIPVKITVDGEVVDNHPLQKLINNPNSVTSYSEMMVPIVSYRLTTGNSYTRKILDGTNTPKELWNLMPYYMTIEDNGKPIPFAYKFSLHSNTMKFLVDQETGQSEILHVKNFSPLQKFLGMSPLSAAAVATDQHNASADWNLSLLQNAAKLPGYLHVDTTITDEQLDRLGQDFADHFSGKENAGKTPVLFNGMTFTPNSLSPTDMDWLAGRKMSAQEICSVFGVPSQVLGIEGSQTFANYSEARLAMWEDTVIPLAENIMAEMIAWLRIHYPEGDRIGFILDLDEVAALAPKRQEMINTLNTIEYMTINEKRAKIGLEPVNNPMADELLIGTGLTPLDDLNMELGTEDGHLTDDEVDELGLQ
jgi:HK97 family phage portal protein